MSDLQQILNKGAHFIGVQHATTRGRILHAFVGAAFGIFFTGFLIRLWSISPSGLPPLVAPIGASAVLLFAVPASPLAQPWAIIGGNTISALSGIFWMKLLGDPVLAAGLAVATAIAMMSLARCLHPPGGAVALTTAIGGHAIVAAGWAFAFYPVAVDCMALVAIGWLYNAATRGNYPHRATSFVAPSAAAAGYTLADIESVLAQYDELLDVSTEDLDTLFRQVEGRAYRRLHGVIRCEQIMQREVATVSPDEHVEHAQQLFNAHQLRAAPVVDDEGHVEGMLTADMLTARADLAIAAVMDLSPCIAPPATPIDELLPLLSGGIYHEAIVVDPKGRLLGLVTQTQLLSALWRGHIAEQITVAG